MPRRVALGGMVAALVVAGALLAALAFGQDAGPVTLGVTASVRPGRAGTPERPQGITFRVRTDFSVPDGTGRPLQQQFDVWLPKGWQYNGARFPACSRALLANGGPSRCPPKSIMEVSGGGHVDELDPTDPPPAITMINGGATKVYFWTVLHNPARVAAAVVGDIVRLTDDARWSYHLRATVPKSLQVVAGVPVTPATLAVAGGHGDWLATTSCPSDHLWRFRVAATSTDGQVVRYDGSVGCRS